MARLFMWLYDQGTILQRWKVTRGWDASIVKWMTRLRSQPICVWVKGGDVSHLSAHAHPPVKQLTRALQIHNLMEAVLYVRKNEITARIIFLHAYENIEDIPSELEANVKILDEAFPVSPKLACSM